MFGCNRPAAVADYENGEAARVRSTKLKTCDQTVQVTCYQVPGLWCTNLLRIDVAIPDVHPNETKIPRRIWRGCADGAMGDLRSC